MAKDEATAEFKMDEVVLTRFYDRELPQILPLELKARILYKDTRFSWNYHDVAIRRFTQDRRVGGVEAWCGEPPSLRGFAYLMILDFINLATGEVIEPRDITYYLFDLYIQTIKD